LVGTGQSSRLHGISYLPDGLYVLTDCTFITFSGSELLRLVQRNVAMGTKIMRNISKVLSKRLPFLQEEDRQRLRKGR
jgi:hypothetical protein